MTDRSRRKELSNKYKQTVREAGVYRIVNTRTGKSFIGSAPDLQAVRNRLAFATSTGSPSALDWRLHKDFREHGGDAFELEVIERLDARPESTEAEIRDDLATLEALTRESFDTETLY